MNSPYSPDYANSILSIFDLAGILPNKNLTAFDGGFEQDMQKLLADRKKLEKDYRRASKRVWGQIQKDN